MAESQTNQNTDVVAYAGRYYRNARYLIALLFLGFGFWCIRDGFFVYPRENQEARQAVPPKAEPHPGYDVPFNRTLGVLLPP
ncbi:MAG TPA: hypothetical protein VHP11_08040, partial [Tepidisphaeraceae bacterium]|nr:hypothetical protein [Tepidisphaeraceae bacterium]